MAHLFSVVPAALLIVLVSACSMTDVQTEQNFAEREEVVYILGSAKMVSAKSTTPQSFHVRGHIQDGKFFPVGEVLGDGELQQETRAYLELWSGKSIPMQSGQGLTGPYVEGVVTDRGFMPSSRTIKYGMEF